MITGEPLLRTVVTRRTDLLGALTGPCVPPNWTPPLTAWVRGRWLPAQRTAFDDRLAVIAAAEDAPLRERSTAAAALRDPAALRSLAGEGPGTGAPQPVAAAALTALAEPGVLPTEEALRVLLPYAAAGGVRSRAAMAGIRRTLGAIDGPAAVKVLGTLLADTGGPVGTRKEAVRALDATGGDKARRALLAGWDAPGQHHDVLAALARPLLAHVAEPDVAARLTGGLRHRAVLDAVAAGQDRLPAAARPPYAAFLAGLIRGAPADQAMAACRAFGQLGADTRAGHARALSAALADPARPVLVRAGAAELLMAKDLPGTARDAFRTALAAVVTQARGEQGDPTLVLLRLGRRTADRDPGADDVLAGALEAAGLRAAAARVAFQAAATALVRGDGSMDRWHRCLTLVADRPHRLDLRQGPQVAGGQHLPAAFATVAGALAAVPTTAAGLIAHWLTGTAGPRTAWADPWPAVLDVLLGHPDPDVAEAALSTGLRRSRDL